MFFKVKVFNNMTRYEQTMYERDLPGIRKSLERIADTLEKMEVVVKDMERIISDPGDEVEHIVDYPAEMSKIYNNEHTHSTQVPSDYQMD
tara:strand:- start:1030 stop:1299 length:270 start_codon:yes stop_codon:yes gene_type:complete